MNLQEHNHDDTKTCPHYVSTIQYYTNTIYVYGITKKENKYRVWTSKGGTSTHKGMNNKSGYPSARVY